MGLTARLSLLIVLALLPALVVQALLARDLQRHRELEAAGEALQLAQFAAGEMDRLIEGAQGFLEAFARLPAIRGGDGPGCAAYAGEMTAKLPQYISIAAFDRDGLPLCFHPPEAGPPPSVKGRPWFEEALGKGSFAIGTVARRPPLGRMTLPLATRFEGRDGRYGVVMAAMDIDWLQGHMARRARSPDGSISIADRDGTFAVRLPPPPFPGDAMRQSANWMLGAAAAGTYEGAGPDGIERIVGYVPPSATGHKAFLVTVGLSKAQVSSEIAAASRRSLIIVLVGMAVALALALFAGRRLIAAPFALLIAAADGWRRGDYSVRTGLRGRAELARLGMAFDEMADSVRDRETALKARERRLELLLHELNHRVKNELQLVMSLLTLHASRAGEAEARALFKDAISRVRSIADVHATLYRDERVAAVEFGSYLRTLCKRLARTRDTGEGAVALEVSAEDARLDAAQAIPLGLIVNELVTNAFKHAFPNGERGTVTVAFGAAPPGTWRLTVADDGKSAPPTSDAGERRGGLGLRLIESLVAQLGGELTITRERGFRAAVSVPATSVTAA